STFTNGTLSTDDYSLYDTIGAPAPAATRAPLGAQAGRVALIVPAPPGASIKVITQSPLYKAMADIPVGSRTQRARADRHAPSVPDKIHLVPGPNLVKPGAPFLLEMGAMTG